MLKLNIAQLKKLGLIKISFENYNHHKSKTLL